MNSTLVRPWPTSLTDCCASPGGLPRCCLACWCPCFSYAELLKEPELKGYCCYGDRVSACVSYALLQTLGFFPAAALHAGARSTLRTERNYSGSLAEDFCATACCSSCSLVQELNAADSRQNAQASSSGINGSPLTSHITNSPPLPVRMTTLNARSCSTGGSRPESRIRQTAAGRLETGQRFYVASAMGDGAHSVNNLPSTTTVTLTSPSASCSHSSERTGALIL